MRAAPPQAPRWSRTRSTATSSKSSPLAAKKTPDATVCGHSVVKWGFRYGRPCFWFVVGRNPGTWPLSGRGRERSCREGGREVPKNGAGVGAERAGDAEAGRLASNGVG